jgi:hypothetical protein
MPSERKIWVPMPETEMYKRTVKRDDLVGRYGEATVSRAEVAVILNLLYMTKIIKPNEFVDLMHMQCERIEDERRAAARLEEDRG